MMLAGIVIGLVVGAVVGCWVTMWMDEGAGVMRDARSGMRDKK